MQRFRRLKQKLKLPNDRCMDTCRHTFAKRTLSGYYTGQPGTIEVLAGLMGNTPKVCWDHDAAWTEQYNDPLWQALGKAIPAKTLTRYRTGILAWYDHPISTGPLEGTDDKIKTLKRQA